MKRKSLILLVTLAATFGCTTQSKISEMDLGPRTPLVIEPASEPITAPPDLESSYVGIAGFLVRPPVFADDVSARAFNRCAPIQIVGIRSAGKTVTVTARQNNNTIRFFGLNRVPFKDNGVGRLPLLDRYWMRSLSDYLGQRNPASVDTRLCQAKVWSGMSATQFRFLAGDPEFRNPLKMAGANYDVWTFVGRDRSKPRYYYFISDQLYSWTR